MLPRIVGSVLAALLAVTLLSPPAAAAPARQVSYQSWDSRAEFNRGVLRGTEVRGQVLRIAQPVSGGTVAGRQYEGGHWISPWADVRFPATELIPSWNAVTPGSGWVRIMVRGRKSDGSLTSWDQVARWAEEDREIKRTTFGRQPDDGAELITDLWRVPSGLSKWQIRVTLMRRAGTTHQPGVKSVGAVATRNSSVWRPSKPTGVASALSVPRYSQMVHRGTYPQYGGGGQAWCSPTATSMVLGYWRSHPPASNYTWVAKGRQTRFVAYAARSTYDWSYRGTGTWPFNTAYAARFAGPSFVTVFHDLRGAERLVRAGIPVVVSIAFGRGQLSGAPISSTDGHLVVITGFTKSGAVRVNDPAAPTNASVKRVYDRAQFEAAWMRRKGVAYVIRDAGTALPGHSPSWQ